MCMKRVGSLKVEYISNKEFMQWILCKFFQDSEIIKYRYVKKTDRQKLIINDCNKILKCINSTMDKNKVIKVDTIIDELEKLMDKLCTGECKREVQSYITCLKFNNILNKHSYKKLTIDDISKSGENNVSIVMTVITKSNVKIVGTNLYKINKSKEYTEPTIDMKTLQIKVSNDYINSLK